MLIEYYGDQLDNKEIFMKEIIEAYDNVADRLRKYNTFERLDNFDNWNPLDDYNDMWKIVDLLEGFGHPSHDYDTALYDFELAIPEGNTNYIIYKGEGLSYNQAVANTLINFSNGKIFKKEESGETIFVNI